MVQQCPYALRGVHGGFIGEDERISPIRETRRSAQQEVPCRPVGSPGINAIAVDPCAETEQSIRRDIVVWTSRVHENGLWVNLGGLLRLLDVDGTRRDVYCDYLTNLLAPLANLISSPEVCFLLLEGIAICRYIPLHSDALNPV